LRQEFFIWLFKKNSQLKYKWDYVSGVAAIPIAQNRRGAPQHLFPK